MSMTDWYRTLILAILLGCSVYVFPSDATDKLSILSVTPEGPEVPVTRGTIVIEFNKPMVSLGQTDRDLEEVVVQIKPRLKCEWRWTSTTQLTCRFLEYLRHSGSYSIDINGTFEAVDGTAIAIEETFTFKTSSLSAFARADDWHEPASPVIAITFTQPVDLETVLENVRFRNIESSELTDIKIGSTEAKRGLTLYARLPGRELYRQHESGNWYRMTPNDEARTRADLESHANGGTGDFRASYRIASRRWTIEPIQSLTSDSSYEVVVDSGVTSIFGAEPTQSELVAMRLRTFSSTFELVGLECAYTDGSIQQHITEDNNQAMLSDCEPDEGITFLFTAPMEWGMSRRFDDQVSLSPESHSHRHGSSTNFYGFRWSNFYRENEASQYDEGYYKISVRYVLDGKTTYRVNTRNVRIEDLFGREISSIPHLQFRTGHRKPSLGYQYHDFVMSTALRPRLPLEVANLRGLKIEVLGDSRVRGKRSKSTKTVKLQTPTDKVVTRHIDIGSWTRSKTGQFVASIEGTPKTGFESTPFVSCLLGQISPYGVNARIGHESSIAWVTDLQSGELVPNATVELVQLEGENSWSLFKSETNDQGIAHLPGRSQFPDHSTSDEDPVRRIEPRNVDDCASSYETKYLLRVEGPLGLATLLVTEDGRLPVERGGPNLLVWGHTAKGIYQPGEVLNYKIYVREQTDSGLRVNRSGRYRLVVERSPDEIVHEKRDIELNEFGTFHGEFQIPERAVGSLSFSLVLQSDDGTSLWDDYSESIDRFKAFIWTAFKVDVLDFNPTGIRFETALNKTNYKLGDEMIVEGSVDLLSGGTFSNAPVLVDVKFLPGYFHSRHPRTQDFHFVGHLGESRDLTPFVEFPSGQTTDHEGRFHASVPLAIEDDWYGKLDVRIGVQEDTGNVIWKEQQANYASVDRFVGGRLNGQKAYVGKPMTVEAVVVNQEGKPTNDEVVHLQIMKHVLDSEKRSQWAIVHYCKLEIEDTPRECTFVPEDSGSYRVAATIESDNDRRQRVTFDLHVFEEDTTGLTGHTQSPGIINWHSVANRQFNIGEIATVELGHSHPGSHVLVTIERLGILDQWIVELEGKTSTIAFPIKASYAPKTKVVLTVMTSNSLIKPNQFIAPEEQQTFPNSWTRSVPLHIRDPSRELDIGISTDKTEYEPGERVSVSISVNDKSGLRSPQNAELAVAVVDQGVLEVARAGIQHFDPVVGFQRDYYFAVTDHWILKPRFVMYMRSPGNRVAEEEPRTNNSLLSFWTPNLRTDKDGNASFEFEVADRLTEWKIIVVGATADNQFGVGHVSIKTNLGIEVHPALPNQVSDGDEFDADFMILNRTDSERQVTVEIQTEGDAESLKHSEQVTVQPFERKRVSARTSAQLRHNRGPKVPGSISFLVTASDSEHSDALVQHVPVHPSRRMFVSSIYGTTTETRVTEPIEFPSDIRNGTGSLQIEVSPSLVNAAEQNLAQVRDYPYKCWEQRLSTAVVAAHYTMLRDRLQVEWQDADAYVEEVLESAVDYQSDRGGFAYWTGESDYADPYLSAYTALAFHWLQEAGYEVPELLLQKLLGYLERHLSAPFPEYFGLDKSTVPTLRLLLANALIQHDKADLELLSELYVDIPSSNLFAVAQTLEAAVELNAPSELLDSLTARLRSGIGVSGDRALIQHQTTRGGNFLLSSTMKTTCSAISAFVRAHNSGKSLVPVNKLSELVRGAMFEWNHQGLRTSPHRASYCLRAIVEYAEHLEEEGNNFAVDVQFAFAEQLEALSAILPSTEQPHNRSMLFDTPLRPDFLGKQGRVLFDQPENSRFYYKATLKYEPNEIQTDRENYGIDIRKTYWIKKEDDWVELDSSASLSRGDVVHVGLFLDIRDQRDFVIVDDPVPGALEPINTTLAKTNDRELAPTRDFFGALIPKGIEGVWNTLGSSRWCFYRQEIRHDSVRFMSDFLPPGRYRLYWSGRVISTGEFVARPAHAEAMYSPEIYGNTKPQRISAGAN